VSSIYMTYQLAHTWQLTPTKKNYRSSHYRKFGFKWQSVIGHIYIKTLCHRLIHASNLT
jgi:hypothetical protein